MDRERNLLFGVLAVQMGKISPNQFMQSAAAWAVDPSRDLPGRLVETGLILERDRRLILDLLEREIEAHDGDTAATLAAYGGQEQIEQVFGEALQGREAPILYKEERPATLDHAEVLGVEETPGRYSRLSEHGRGGMGRVLLVHDAHLTRDIAYKELLPSQVATVSESSPVRHSTQLVARFLQEARITGQLEHPSIVPVYELGHRRDGTLYYTMKLVRGKTLTAAINDAHALQERLLLLPHFIDLCQAIAYAHSRGVIHRDIKPSNIMVGDFGETVVLDWGLAKAKGRADVHTSPDEKTRMGMRVEELGPEVRTEAGRAVGTPGYMPPEQVQGDIESVDERSDVYALGAVLYQLLTGKRPYEGATGRDALWRVLHESPEPITHIEPGAPPELAAICERAMQRDRQARYPSAQELAKDVQRFQTGALVQAYSYSLGDHLWRFVKRHKTMVTMTAAAVLLLVAIGAVYNVQLAQSRDRERSQRMAAESANRQLRWENYSMTITVAQKHINEDGFATAIRLLEQAPSENRGWEWGRLKRLCSPEIWSLSDERTPDAEYGMHGGIAVSPDGRFLLLQRLFSGLTQIFDLEADHNVLLQRLAPPDYLPWRRCAHFIPGSNAFIAPTGPTSLGRFTFDPAVPDTDYENRRLEPELVYDAVEGELRSAALSGTGTLLAGFVLKEGNEAEIVIWEAATGDVRSRHALNPLTRTTWLDAADDFWEHRILPVQGGVLGFLEDESQLAFVDDALGVLDLNTGTREYLADCHFLAAFAVEQAQAAVVTPHGPLQLWDLRTRTLVTALDGDFRDRMNIDIQSDGSLLYFGRPRLEVWSVSTGTRVHRSEQAFFDFKLSPNGACIAGLHMQAVPYPLPAIWEARAPRDTITAPFIDEAGAPLEVAFAEEAHNLVHAYDHGVQRLATAEPGGVVHLWQVPGFQRLASWQAAHSTVRQIAFSRDDQRIATASQEGVVVWSTPALEPLVSINPDPGHEFSSCAFSADGAWLAIGSTKTGAGSDEGFDLARVVDAGTGELVYVVTGHPGACNYVGFSPDGRWLLTGTYGAPSLEDAASLFIWDAQTGQNLAGQINSLNWPWHVSFTRDASRMVVIGLTTQPCVWDFNEQRELYRISSGSARQVVMHPDGDRFAVIRLNGVAIHALRDGRELVSFPAGTTPGAFSSDGRDLYCRLDRAHMLVMKAEDWSDITETARYQQSLEEARRLLELDG